MKRYIVVILVLCLSGIPPMLGELKANEHVTKEEDGHGYRWHRHKPTYFVGRNGVFFDGRPIKDASPSSFRILGDGYAVDNWHVYYRGNVMAEAALSLEVLGYGYVKDAWNVFYDGRKIEGASAGTFSVTSDWYAKDNWSVFFDGKKVDGASTGSFKVLRDGYAKDNWAVYYDGIKVKDASPDSFSCRRGGYAEDNWSTFYRGKKLD